MIQLERAAVGAGDLLSGSLATRPPCGKGEEVTVWLVWRVVATRTLVNFGRRVDESYCIIDTRPLPGDSRHFEFRIPAAGPLTYEGKLFNVVWEIVAGTTSPRSRVSVAAHQVIRVGARAAVPLFGAA